MSWLDDLLEKDRLYNLYPEIDLLRLATALVAAFAAIMLLESN